jgi:hypothetical protein
MQGKCNVFKHGETGDQVAGLEHEPQVLTSEPGHLPLAQGSYFRSETDNPAAVRQFQSTQAVEQGGFA